jgi:hypothetical protein
MQTVEIRIVIANKSVMIENVVKLVFSTVERKKLNSRLSLTGGVWVLHRHLDVKLKRMRQADPALSIVDGCEAPSMV